MGSELAILRKIWGSSIIIWSNNFLSLRKFLHIPLELFFCEFRIAACMGEDQNTMGWLLYILQVLEYFIYCDKFIIKSLNILTSVMLLEDKGPSLLFYYSLKFWAFNMLYVCDYFWELQGFTCFKTSFLLDKTFRTQLDSFQIMWFLFYVKMQK